MALLVQKFGGTSVGTIERIQSVARWVLDQHARGDSIAVVVSAMSGETNRLIGLAQQIHATPHSREYDMLIASGEQVSAGLVSLAINTEAERRGLLKPGEYRSRPLLGHQIGILTDQVFSKARIRAIDTVLLRAELDAGKIPVIAGFQGVDSDNNITTLGRGGSDTSAVAIAAALRADDCEIYTDVDGVYTTDPRICPRARKMKRVSYDEMMELAGLGAKVLQIRSVELAAKHRVPLHVRSSFEPQEGTRVVAIESLGKDLEQVVVAGIATDKAQVKFTLGEVADRPGEAARIFGELSRASIVVDVITWDAPRGGKLSMSFTVGDADAAGAARVLATIGGIQIREQRGLAKVSIVGVGMQHHPGVASKMFSILAGLGINIELVTTSEIKVSCLIDEARLVAAVQALHTEFGLDA